MKDKVGLLDLFGYYLFGKPNLVIREKDNFKPWGRLQIFQRVDGEDVLVHDEKNTIMDVGRLEVLSFLSAGSSRYIKYMRVGNGNVPNTAPDESDLGLANTIIESEFSSVDVDTVNNIIEFRATFNSGSLTPGSISPEEVNEAGLFFDDYTIFARKTFSARPFLIVENIYLTFIWSVGVA